jgi:uncharacterized membrane-anchored protein
VSNVSKKYIFVAVIPVIMLFSMIIMPLATAIFGSSITLETKVTGNYNSFRGKGIALDYKINYIDKDKFPETLQGMKPQYLRLKDITAYAVLKGSGEYYSVSSVVLKRPESGLYLKCIVPAYSFYNNEPGTQNNEKVYVRYAVDMVFNTFKDITEISTNNEDYNYEAKVKIYRGYAEIEDVSKK